jgi:ABC-type multidrug transport system ATPase subunit
MASAEKSSAADADTRVSRAPSVAETQAPPLEELVRIDASLLGHVQPVTLAWNDVSLTVDNKAAVRTVFWCVSARDVSEFAGRARRTRPSVRPPFRSRRPPGDAPPRLTILRDASGCVHPGELVAVMGASGAGKTTLLNVLARRNTKNEGTLALNGAAVSEARWRRAAAFVQQDDLFLSTLTVREHLMFQAQLRLDADVPDADKASRVERLLEALRLTKCANNVIGSTAAGKTRGISGGERKRLAFASEIITDPSLLFCDEPTSGLDSHMAENVVRMMRELARVGRTVVATIHQPSSEVFALFDLLMLLRDGRVVYYGRREDAVDYFAAFGEDFRCPVYTNPADFFIRILAVRDASDPRTATVERMADAWAASEARKHFDARAPPVLGAHAEPASAAAAVVADVAVPAGGSAEG